MTIKNSHILIVDDNPENIKVLGAALANNDYKISIASNGEIALKLIEKSLPDLILLDVMMPEMDGFQVCETLKSNPRTKEIEVIFITAAIACHDELKGLSMGAVDYIHKPFSIPIVQAKVALHLERIQHKRLREDIDRISRHDLKNPLNALLGYPQLMLHDDNLTDEQREYLKEMLKAGKEMLTMINNSLDLFKMETGRYNYMPEQVDMALVISSVIKDLREVSEGYGIKIKFVSENGTDQPFMLMADRHLSYSLFANLIRNAVEACSVGDTVIIAASQKNNEGIISVTNPGSVPESIRDIFFEKYATAGKTYGTGLGTYSARLMTATQNGTIAMTTNSEETCITVKLPVA